MSYYNIFLNTPSPQDWAMVAILWSCTLELITSLLWLGHFSTYSSHSAQSSHGLTAIIVGTQVILLPWSLTAHTAIWSYAVFFSNTSVKLRLSFAQISLSEILMECKSFCCWSFVIILKSSSLASYSFITSLFSVLQSTAWNLSRTTWLIIFQTKLHPQLWNSGSEFWELAQETEQYVYMWQSTVHASA